MAIVFPAFEYPSRLQELDFEIASMIQDAHEATVPVELLDLATKIRRYLTEGLTGFDEDLDRVAPSCPRPTGMPLRERLETFKADGGMLSKPRITITAAMQSPCAS